MCEVTLQQMQGVKLKHQYPCVVVNEHFGSRKCKIFGNFLRIAAINYVDVCFIGDS